jgi:hypothetical protein
LKISDETHHRLSKHGNIGDTFEEVIKKLLDSDEGKTQNMIHILS